MIGRVSTAQGTCTGAENLQRELPLRSRALRSGPRSLLTEYLFNTRKNQHFFCKVCGVRAFGVGNETPMGKMSGVNIGCLEGVTEEELSKIPVTCIDGLHDRWQHAPEFSSHL